MSPSRATVSNITVMMGWCVVAERLVIGALLTLRMLDHSLTAMLGWRLSSSG
jgi:hypothetical protein